MFRRMLMLSPQLLFCKVFQCVVNQEVERTLDEAKGVVFFSLLYMISHLVVHILRDATESISLHFFASISAGSKQLPTVF